MKVIKAAERKTYQRDSELIRTVADIMDRVKTEGDAALLSYAERFDHVQLPGVRVSPETVKAAYDKVDPETEFLVIYDDISLAPGHLRIRKKGSAGGHNGIKNIILHLGTQVFPRVRVGVGEKPEGYDLADYVLGHFQGDEKKLMEEAYDRAAAAVAEILTDGPDKAMNDFN